MLPLSCMLGHVIPQGRLVILLAVNVVGQEQEPRLPILAAEADASVHMVFAVRRVADDHVVFRDLQNPSTTAAEEGADGD